MITLSTEAYPGAADLTATIDLVKASITRFTGLVDDRRQEAEKEVGQSDVTALLDAAYRQAETAQPGAAYNWRRWLNHLASLTDAQASLERLRADLAALVDGEVR